MATIKQMRARRRKLHQAHADIYYSIIMTEYRDEDEITHACGALAWIDREIARYTYRIAQKVTRGER